VVFGYVLERLAFVAVIVTASLAFPYRACIGR
jgi:hypothetical protein